MKVNDGKIAEITEAELFGLYLDRDMDNEMDFREYKARMREAGCLIVEGEQK